MFDRLAIAVFLLVVAAQVMLGLWRAHIMQSSIAPAFALTAVIATVAVLWFAHRHDLPGGFLAKPAALLLTTVGALSACSAFNAPLIGLIAQVSTPLFAFSAAGVLAGARLEPRIQAATLSSFVGGVAVLEIALTRDALWNA